MSGLNQFFNVRSFMMNGRYLLFLSIAFLLGHYYMDVVEPLTSVTFNYKPFFSDPNFVLLFFLAFVLALGIQPIHKLASSKVGWRYWDKGYHYIVDFWFYAIIVAVLVLLGGLVSSVFDFIGSLFDGDNFFFIILLIFAFPITAGIINGIAQSGLKINSRTMRKISRPLASNQIYISPLQAIGTILFIVMVAIAYLGSIDALLEEPIWLIIMGAIFALLWVIPILLTRTGSFKGKQQIIRSMTNFRAVGPGWSVGTLKTLLVLGFVVWVLTGFLGQVVGPPQDLTPMFDPNLLNQLLFAINGNFFGILLMVVFLTSGLGNRTLFLGFLLFLTGLYNFALSNASVTDANLAITIALLIAVAGVVVGLVGPVIYEVYEEARAGTQRRSVRNLVDSQGRVTYAELESHLTGVGMAAEAYLQKYLSGKFEDKEWVWSTDNSGNKILVTAGWLDRTAREITMDIQNKGVLARAEIQERYLLSKDAVDDLVIPKMVLTDISQTSDIFYTQKKYDQTKEKVVNKLRESVQGISKSEAITMASNYIQSPQLANQILDEVLVNHRSHQLQLIGNHIYTQSKVNQMREALGRMLASQKLLNVDEISNVAQVSPAETERILNYFKNEEQVVDNVQNWVMPYNFSRELGTYLAATLKTTPCISYDLIARNVGISSTNDLANVMTSLSDDISQVPWRETCDGDGILSEAWWELERNKLLNQLAQGQKLTKDYLIAQFGLPDCETEFIFDDLLMTNSAVASTDFRTLHPYQPSFERVWQYVKDKHGQTAVSEISSSLDITEQHTQDILQEILKTKPIFGSLSGDYFVNETSNIISNLNTLKSREENLLKQLDSLESQIRGVSSVSAMNKHKNEFNTLNAQFNQTNIPNLDLGNFGSEERQLYQNISALHQRVQVRLNQVRDAMPQREAELEAEALKQRRQDMMKKLTKKVKRMSLTEVAELLEFPDPKQLKKWVFNLPDDSPFKIDGDDLIIETTGMTEDALTHEIDDLLSAFEEAESDPTAKGFKL